MSLEVERKFDRYFNLSVIVLTLSLLSLNFQVLQKLYRNWDLQDLAGTYSHAPLLVILVIYSIYKTIIRNRQYLYPNPSVIGVFLLLISQGILFLAILADVNFIQYVMLVVSILTIVWSAYSWRFAKHFVLPIILLLLSFPIWGDAAQPLQKISIYTTDALLNLTSVPFYRENAFFHFPSGVIEIAPSCSGLQQLLVSLIIGLLFSMQHQLRTRDVFKTLIYISITAVFINTIRIIIIMIVGYFTKMKSSLVTDHILLGWIIYGIGIYIFLHFYSRKKFKVNTVAELADRPQLQSTLSKRVYTTTVILLLIILPIFLNYLIASRINQQGNLVADYKVITNEWIKISDTIDINWKPDFPLGDQIMTGTFKNNNSKIYLYIYRYSTIRQDVEPFNMLNKPYNLNNWNVRKQEIIRMPEEKGTQDKVKLYYLNSRNNVRLTVVSLYMVNGSLVDSFARAKLATLFGKLNLKYDIKVICIATRGNELKDESKIKLIKFYKDFVIK